MSFYSKASFPHVTPLPASRASPLPASPASPASPAPGRRTPMTPVSRPAGGTTPVSLSNAGRGNSASTISTSRSSRWSAVGPTLLAGRGSRRALSFSLSKKFTSTVSLEGPDLLDGMRMRKYTLRFTGPAVEETYQTYLFTKFRLMFRLLYAFGFFLVFVGSMIGTIDPDLNSAQRDNARFGSIEVVLLCRAPFLLMCVAAEAATFWAPARLGRQIMTVHGVMGLMIVMGTTVEGVIFDAFINESHIGYSVVSPIIALACFPVFGKVSAMWTMITTSSTFVVFVALRVALDVFEFLGMDLTLLLMASIVTIVSTYQHEFFARRNFSRQQTLVYDNELLQSHNQKLQRQLRNLNQRISVDVDLDAPAEKAIKLVQQSMSNPRLPPDVVANLETVSRILHSKNLLAPRLANQLQANGGGLNVDQETHNWLFYELASKERRDTQIAERLTPVTPARRANTSRGSLNNATMTLPELDDVELAEILTEFDQWDFDVFKLSAITRGRPLYAVAMHALGHFNLVEIFRLDTAALDSFLTQVELGYRAGNRFHNSMHAADVVHATVYLINAASNFVSFSDLEIFAAIFAAIVHDYDHPGVNNNFHVATSSDLAVLYNDKSVLENHHVSSAFRALLQPNVACNVLQALSVDHYRTFRSIVIDLVLATDVALHFDVLSDFKRSVLTAEGNTVQTVANEHRVLILKMVIKCADISNPAKPPELYRRWTQLVMSEFYTQGDKERANGLPVSPFMDRSKPAVPKCQVGFINFVVRPLYEAFVGEFLGDIGPIRLCDQNKEAMTERQDAGDHMVWPDLHEPPSAASTSRLLPG